MSSRFVRGPMVLNDTAVVTTGDLAVTNESCVIVDKATGAATAVTLPAAAGLVNTQMIFVKDGKGDAHANPITISPASGTISGRPNYKINDPHGAVLLGYNSTAGEWLVVEEFRGLGGGRVRVEEDFLAANGATLPTPWAEQDTSSAGSPTTDYVADALNGEWTAAHDSQAEAQYLTLYWGDQLMIDPTKRPVIEFRMKVNFAGATFTADQRIVIGLATARNNTLDNVAQHAWFRIEGANLNILAETDDGTTDDDDNDTGIDIVDDTYTYFRIDMADTSAVKFYVNGVLGATLDAGDLTAAHKMQPIVEMQKDGGADTDAFVVDMVTVEYDR